MWRLLKRWVVCVIALAISLGGTAVASSLSCGPGYRSSALDMVAGDGDAQAPGAAANPLQRSELLALPSAAGAASLSVPAPTFEANCIAFESCCTSAALHRASVSFKPPPTRECFALAADSSAVPFLTDGLERPPRLFLA